MLSQALYGVQVGKLAKKLPVGNVKAMAAELRTVGRTQTAVVESGNDAEEDLT